MMWEPMTHFALTIVTFIFDSQDFGDIFIVKTATGWHSCGQESLIKYFVKLKDRPF